MKVFPGKVIEIQQQPGVARQALISISGGKAPLPGQYLQAHRLADLDEALPISLYPGGMVAASENTFLSAPPIPPHWQPGDELLLRGPLGKGFSLPPQVSRLALASLGEDPAHLLPLSEMVFKRGGEAALFGEQAYPFLPAQFEIRPLAELEEGLLWANFLAVSGPPEKVVGLKAKLYRDKLLPCPAQALVLTQMPCGGLAQCSVCAMPGYKGQSMLVCEDGPVFEWSALPEKI